MRFFVASLEAQLLPLAHRLRREGHEVEAMVWKPRYENAWGGSIQKIARHTDGTLMASALRPQIEAATAGDLVVVTDVGRVAELFHQAPRLFAVDSHIASGPEPQDVCLIGGWFDGEKDLAPHILCADWGTWAGGLGPHRLGAITLIRPEGVSLHLPARLHEAGEEVRDRLKHQGFRGLFHYDVSEDLVSGDHRLKGLRAGWPWLHTQAFVAEVESLSAVLLGEVPRLHHRFVTVVPISIPPWPHEKPNGADKGLAVEGLTAQQQGKLFWFDIEVDHAARKLRTAGLDGLLAVATGSSDSTPALSRARALDLAVRLQVPGKQYRQDSGLAVDALLSTLEDRLGFVPF
jgi:hypothetical protein